MKNVIKTFTIVASAAWALAYIFFLILFTTYDNDLIYTKWYFVVPHACAILYLYFCAKEGKTEKAFHYITVIIAIAYLYFFINSKAATGEVTVAYDGLNINFAGLAHVLVPFAGVFFLWNKKNKGFAVTTLLGLIITIPSLIILIIYKTYLVDPFTFMNFIYFIFIGINTITYLLCFKDKDSEETEESDCLEEVEKE